MTNNKISNKAVIYLRVSSKGQEEHGYSLDAQEKMAQEYASRHGLEVVKIWKGAESAWGREERSNFSAMLSFVKKHTEVQHVIFYVLDRMTRNDMDKIKIAELVKDYDKIIHFSRDNKIYSRSSSPDDEFMLDVQVAVAKKLSNDISRKTAMGMQEKAEQGIFPACAPIGYLNNKLTKKIDIDTERASFIKKIFEMSASGDYSLEMITNQLYADGFRNKRGKKVVKATIHKILKNTIYYGEFKWKDKIYQGKHTVIITKELYERANKALSRFHRPHLTKKNYPFSNLLHCKKCGCFIVGNLAKNKYMYYRCSGAKGTHPNEKYIRDYELDGLFEQIVQNIKITPGIANWLQKAVNHKLKYIEKTENKEIGKLKILLAKTHNDLERLYQEGFAKGFSVEFVNKTEQNYKQKIAQLEQQIQNRTINPQEICQKSIDVLKLVCNIGAIYKNMPLNEKRTFLCKIGADFLLENRKIEVIYREPFNIFAAGNKKCLENGLNSPKSSKHIIWGRTTKNHQTKKPLPKKEGNYFIKFWQDHFFNGKDFNTPGNKNLKELCEELYCISNLIKFYKNINPS